MVDGTTPVGASLVDPDAETGDAGAATMGGREGVLTTARGVGPQVPEDGMRAGRSEIEVGAMVRVKAVGSRDPEDQGMVGVEGKATHPFSGLMTGDSSDYLMGLWLDDKNLAKAATVGAMACGLGGGGMTNLLVGDVVEVVKEGRAVDG